MPFSRRDFVELKITVNDEFVCATFFIFNLELADPLTPQDAKDFGLGFVNVVAADGGGVQGDHVEIGGTIIVRVEDGAAGIGGDGEGFGRDDVFIRAQNSHPVGPAVQ